MSLTGGRSQHAWVKVPPLCAGIGVVGWLVTALAPAVGLTVNSALRINSEAEDAFSRGDYITAGDKARVADDFLLGNRVRSNQTIYGIASAEVVAERARMGPIRPESIVRALVLYLKSTDVVYHKQRVRAAMKPEDIAATRTQLGVFRRYIEVLGQGRLTMDFDYLPLDAELSDLDSRTEATPAGPTEINKGGLESVRKALRVRRVFDELLRHDVCFLYWCDYGIGSNAYGTREHIESEDGRVCDRGIVRMPIGFKWPGTLLHEYFHVVEDTYRITPRHGFLPGQRKAFPGWRGEGQYSYYQWQFQDILRSRDLAELNAAR